MPFINRAIELEPEESYNFIIRGQAYLRMKFYEKALDDYNHAIKLKPIASQYYSRALAYQEMKSYPEAQKDFSTAIEMNPSDADYLTARADCFLQAGEKVKAVADYTQSISLKADADSFSERGLILIELNEFEHAFQDYEEAIKLDPEDPYKYLNYAEAFIIASRPEKSVEILNKMQSSFSEKDLNADFAFTFVYLKTMLDYINGSDPRENENKFYEFLAADKSDSNWSTETMKHWLDSQNNPLSSDKRAKLIKLTEDFSPHQ